VDAPVRADLAVAAARARVGAAYSASGDTPRTGFSCVGLVHWAYARAGIAVPESESELAAAYPAVIGATATGAGLRPGDILLYRDTGWAGLSHASIYAGGGLMVSADSPESGVRLEPIGDAYWVAHWAGAVRVPAAQHPLRPNPAVGW
jgi:cell wall-associated NlpC family hydrolase